MDESSLKFNKDIFRTITETIKKKLEANGIREEDVLEDFEKFRKTGKTVKPKPPAA